MALASTELCHLRHLRRPTNRCSILSSPLSLTTCVEVNNYQKPMNFNWQRAVKDAQRHGYASSGALGGFEKIRFYIEGNNLKMVTHSGSVKVIESMQALGIRTIHCLPAPNAIFTQLGAHDLAIIEKFTQAIIRGEVRIAGEYDCVNNLGSQPLPNAVSISPVVPVPIKLRHGDEYYISTNKKKVTRGSASWYIHTGHVEGTTASGGDRELMATDRVYMCGNTTPEPAQPDPKYFGTLKHLPPELVHDSDSELHSQVVLQDFNNLRDVHLQHIVVEDTQGNAGMTGISTWDLDYHQELRFYPYQSGIHERLATGSSYIEPTCEPYICAGPKGLPDIVVFSKVELKKSYRVVHALATCMTLSSRTHRLEEALPRYMKAFPKADLKQVSQAFGSTPLAFLTHLGRLRLPETPFRGHLCHTFLSSTTKTPAIDVPAYSRKALEGYTLADAGSHDISLVQGGIVTYTYDQSSKTYHAALNELGQAKLLPEAQLA